MILKFLFNLVFFFTGINPASSKLFIEGPHPPTSVEAVAPTKLIPATIKKDSVAQTQTPIIIFKLINTIQPASSKNTGSLKNAGKLARTANNHSITGKI